MQCESFDPLIRRSRLKLGIMSDSISLVLNYLIVMLALCDSLRKQVELHPRWQQKRLRDYCASVGIIVEAWSPLGAPGQKYGTDDLLMNTYILGIAAKHQKTAAQVHYR